jgi:hypothetical protein
MAETKYKAKGAAYSCFVVWTADLAGWGRDLGLRPTERDVVRFIAMKGHPNMRANGDAFTWWTKSYEAWMKDLKIPTKTLWSAVDGLVDKGLLKAHGPHPEKPHLKLGFGITDGHYRAFEGYVEGRKVPTKKAPAPEIEEAPQPTVVPSLGAEVDQLAELFTKKYEEVNKWHPIVPPSDALGKTLATMLRADSAKVLNQCIELFFEAITNNKNFEPLATTLERSFEKTISRWRPQAVNDLAEVEREEEIYRLQQGRRAIEAEKWEAGREAREAAAAAEALRISLLPRPIDDLYRDVLTDERAHWSWTRGISASVSGNRIKRLKLLDHPNAREVLPQLFPLFYGESAPGFDDFSEVLRLALTIPDMTEEERQAHYKWISTPDREGVEPPPRR